MRKIFLILFLLGFYQLSFSQNNTGKDFFNSLYENLKNSKQTIKIHQTNYSCLGDSSTWEVLIKPISNKFEIQFIRNDRFFQNIIKKPTLDTTFQVLKKDLLKKIKNEAGVFSNRVVFIEGSFKIILIIDKKETQYLFRKADGLDYIFRYNKVGRLSLIFKSAFKAIDNFYHHNF